MTNFLIKTVLLSWMIQTVHPRNRQAPYCVDPKTQPNLKRFEPIMDNTNAHPNRFIAVSPDTYGSPTGFIQNITLTRIELNPSIGDVRLGNDHVWKKLHNFFHVTIKAVPGSGGMQGLYIQAIGAPLGIPIGEWVTDFDCDDCKTKTSELKDITYLIPCSHVPAVSFIGPTVLSIGGDPAAPERTFNESHFNFRYIDYPCHDVLFAQFLIIAVRTWSPLQYEVFYSPLYKVNVEGIGSPYPFYYGFETAEVKCHEASTVMNNWIPQHTQKAKVKFSEAYEDCILGRAPSLVAGRKICPPGPFWCGYEKVEDGKPPQTTAEWAKYRRDYMSENNAATGTHVFCRDCGEWEDKVGPRGWGAGPPVSIGSTDGFDQIDTQEKPLVEGEKVTKVIYYNSTCELRDAMGKNVNGSRDRRRDAPDCEDNFDEALVNRGYRAGRKLLQIHGLIMIFACIVGTNCLIFCGRFLKEASIIEKDSGCFGIGSWMIDHMFWTYVTFAALGAGVGLFGAMGREQLNITCYIYDLKEETEDCKESTTVHVISGSFAVLFYVIGFASGWTRPVAKMLRNAWVLLHILCGYLGKYIGLLALISIPSVLHMHEYLALGLSELAFWILFVAATLIQCDMDRKTKDQIKDRKCFPTVEGVDTLKKPPMNKCRLSLFPILTTVEIVFFIFVCFYHYG